VATRAREFRFYIDLSPSGELRDETGARLEVPPEWTPEHLLLAALGRCSLASLRYHAKRGEIEVRSTSGSSRALVTRREDDGRYAFVETDVEIHVTLEPEPGQDELAALLANAERDCFVGASLTAKPRYHWTVNGRAVEA
jgi:uncharacterized OsmC-like protein